MFTLQEVALPLKKRALRGRRLAVVDIENVVGGAVMTVDQAVCAQQSIEVAAGLSGDEHIVIGTSHVGLIATGLGWRGPRLVARSGEDGADLALLEVLNEERVEQRFDEVFLVSGDGIFADAVAALGAAGVRVTVVARREACSRKLRMAAARTIYLDFSAIELEGLA